MKKNINKLIALGIGLSVIVGNVSPVLATEVIKDSKANTISASNENNLKILTLDKAIDAAISKDDQIRILSITINYYKGLDDYYDEADDENGQDQNDINIDATKQSREFRKDGVKYEITNLYNSIVLTEKQVDYQRECVQNEQIKTNNLRLKYNKGLVDSVSMDKQEASLKSQKDTLQAKINSLNDLKEKLKLATGINVNNYLFDDKLNYEKLKVDQDIESYIDDRISVITKYDRELVELSKDIAHDMKDDDYDDLDSLLPNKDDFYSTQTNENGEEEEVKVFNKTGYESAKTMALNAYKGYLGVKMSGETGSAKLNIAEKAYKNSLRSTYSNILAIEDGIDQINSNIQITNKSLSNLKLQYELGLMTKNDYNTAVTGAEQLDITLRQTLNQYYQLKTVFEKPWAVSNSSSGQQ